MSNASRLYNVKFGLFCFFQVLFFNIQLILSVSILLDIISFKSTE